MHNLRETIDKLLTKVRLLDKQMLVLLRMFHGTFETIQIPYDEGSVACIFDFGPQVKYRMKICSGEGEHEAIFDLNTKIEELIVLKDYRNISKS